MTGCYFRRESRTVYANELACDKSIVICIIKNSITNQMRCQAIPWFMRLDATTSQTSVIFSESQGKICWKLFGKSPKRTKDHFLYLIPFLTMYILWYIKLIYWPARRFKGHDPYGNSQIWLVNNRRHLEF